MTETLSHWINQYTDLIVGIAINLVVALIILWVGLRIAKVLMRALERRLDKLEVDASLRPFLVSVAGALLKVMVFVSAISTLGVEMASFVAILGAAGLAVGLALSGTLQNFAGGVIILLIKPFRKGDFITAQGYSGTVDEIQVFHTHLNTPDNKRIILPNGPLSTGSVTNFSYHDTRRVDFTFGIGYDDDIDKAKSVITGVFEKDDRILADKGVFVAVNELADSSVNFTVRVWSKTTDYWPLFWDKMEEVKKALDLNEINIPYPQRDVHLHQKN